MKKSISNIQLLWTRTKNTLQKMSMSKYARYKIHVGKSRMWNMDKNNTKKLPYSLGYSYEKKPVLDFFKITDYKDLSIVDAVEKN